MRYIFGIVLSLFLTNVAYSTPAKVSGFIDGDTFFATFLDGENKDTKVMVRFANVDTPEKDGSCESETRLGTAAYNRLKTVMPKDTVVELKNVTKDKFFGRISANVILPDGRDVGEILIKENVGRAFKGEHKSWCK